MTRGLLLTNQPERVLSDGDVRSVVWFDSRFVKMCWHSTLPKHDIGNSKSSDESYLILGV
jgi:hypothetical protein